MRGGAGGFNECGHRVVWCLPLHFRQRNLDWQLDDLWFPKQLKHSFSCLTIDHLSWQSLTTWQLWVGWGPLQYAHRFVLCSGLYLVVGGFL